MGSAGAAGAGGDWAQAGEPKSSATEAPANNVLLDVMDTALAAPPERALTAP